jgi:hypothetical protein
VLAEQREEDERGRERVDGTPLLRLVEDEPDE